jgi:hypothetical protein
MTMSDWIALSSLGVAIAAFWRSGRARVLDLRTTVLRDSADTRLALDQLAEKIPRCLQSRQAVCSMGGQSGALAQFQEGVARDTEELGRLRNRLAGIPWISTLDRYGAAEDAAVAVQEIRTRVQQLSDKYAAAWAEDEAARARRHAEIVAHASRSG